MLKFTDDGQKLELIGDPHVVADSFDFLTGSFKFYSGHDWDLTEKHVFFQLGEATPYEVTLTDDEFVKTDHVNLTTGTWSIYVIGYDIDGATLVERITTNKVSLTAQISGVPEGEPFPPSIIPDVLIVKDQTVPQTFINGVPRLAADRVIENENDMVDAKFVIDNLPVIPAHNGLASIQGGSAEERYHMTAAQHTVIGNTSGTNTGDQDVSGAISSHNTDEGAHAGIITQINNIVNYQGNRFAMALGAKLRAGIESACIMAQGDSTGNESTDWFERTMEWLASEHHLYTMKIREWDDTNQCYGLNRVFQTGTDGAGYAVFNGSNTKIYANSTSGLAVTGDIDIRCKIAPNSWTAPSAAYSLVDKLGNAGDRGYSLIINTEGKPYFWWSANGTDLLGGSGTYATSSAAISGTDGVPLWVRGTIDVDNGAGGHTIKFYTSVDGSTWTQLGVDRVGSGTTSIHAGTGVLNLGLRATNQALAGKYYEAIIMSGIGGKIVASFDAMMMRPSGATTMIDCEGNLWTIQNPLSTGNGAPGIMVNNACTSGKTVSYSTDATRFALQTAVAPDLAFINYSHNEGTVTAYQTTIEGLATLLVTKFPNVGVVLSTQNLEKSPRAADLISAHHIRQSRIAIAAAKNNYGLVDVYSALIRTGTPNDYTLSDGVHPTSDCSILWAECAKLFLAPTA